MKKIKLNRKTLVLFLVVGFWTGSAEISFANSGILIHNLEKLVPQVSGEDQAELNNMVIQLKSVDLNRYRTLRGPATDLFLKIKAKRDAPQPVEPSSNQPPIISVEEELATLDSPLLTDKNESKLQIENDNSVNNEIISLSLSESLESSDTTLSIENPIQVENSHVSIESFPTIVNNNDIFSQPKELILENIEDQLQSSPLLVMATEGLVDVSTINTPYELYTLLSSCRSYVEQKNLDEKEYLITTITILDYLEEHLGPNHSLSEIAQKALRQRENSAIEGLEKQDKETISIISYLHKQLQSYIFKKLALEQYLKDEELQEAYEKAIESEHLDKNLETKNHMDE